MEPNDEPAVQRLIETALAESEAAGGPTPDEIARACAAFLKARRRGTPREQCAAFRALIGKIREWDAATERFGQRMEALYPERCAAARAADP